MLDLTRLLMGNSMKMSTMGWISKIEVAYKSPVVSNSPITIILWVNTHILDFFGSLPKNDDFN